MRWLAALLAALGLSTAYFGGDVLITADLPAEALIETTMLDAKDANVQVSSDGIIEIIAKDKHYRLEPLTVKFDNGLAKGKGYPFLSKSEASLDAIWGLGSKIDVDAKPGRISKVVSFTDDYLKTIPPGAKYLEVSFELSGDWQLADGTYTSRTELAPEVWLEKALAWDSSGGDPNQNYTDVEFVVSGNTLTKRIPVAWLNTAVFPIHTDATFTFGTKQLADVGPSGTVDVLPIGTDKAAICWHDNGDGTNEGQCVVATVSGNTLTFGSISDFEPDAEGANNLAMGACAVGTDRWLLVYNEDNSPGTDLGRARVASSSGTTINGYGTEFTFNSATTSSPVCTYVSTDKVVIVYNVQGTSGQLLSILAKACQIGTDYTLSCGSATALNASSLSANPFADISCATVSVDAFVCIYEDVSPAPDVTLLNAGTVSGTTITIGATSTASASDQESFGHHLVSPSTGKFAFIFSNTGPSSPQTLGMGTVSGTTITIGATSTLNSTTTSFSSLLALDGNNASLFYQQGATDAGTTFTAAIPIKFNWDTLTFSTSTAETVDATTDPGSLHAAKIGDCKILFAWEDDNDTNDLFAKIGGCASSFAPWQHGDF